MACNLPTSWKPVIHSQVSNTMDQQNLDIITSALLGNNNLMLSAVASLLSRHQNNSSHKEHETLLVSTKLDPVNNTSRSESSMLANVILSTAQNKSSISEVGKSHSQENLISSFKQVHALATASLVESTQRDIAKQLAEASNPSHVDCAVKPVKYSDRKDLKDTLFTQKSDSPKKNEKRISKNPVELPVPSIVDLKGTFTSEPKALICSYEGCHRKFAWLNHLKYHELTHTNNRQFKCPEDSCDKTFFTAQRLSVHQRTHTGEKPFRCSHHDCLKTFTTAGNLKNHQRIHTGEQPFICDYLNCNRRFTEQSSLRKHKLTHSGDKPFECSICGKKFTQSGSRRKHLIRHHLDDEIRESLKQEGIDKDDEDDEIIDQVRKDMPSSGTNPTLMGDSSTVNTVSCSPQVLVLNNTYSGLSTSESVVLSHGLSDHIVTVKTEVLDHRMSVDSHTSPLTCALLSSDGLTGSEPGALSQSLSDHIVTVKTEVLDHRVNDSHSISLSRTLLSSDGLHDGVLHGKPDDFVVLPQASIYEQDENTGDIVYTANILDHEEVTHTDYVSSHVDFSGEISHSNYSTHRGLSSGDDFVYQEVCHSENYITHSGDIAVAEYVATECIQHVTNNSIYTNSKTMPHSYLDSEQDIAHTEFIGAEEIAVSQYPIITSSSDFVCDTNVSSECHSHRTALLTPVAEHFQYARKMFALGEAALIGHSASYHQELAYIPDVDQSVVVVEVPTHSSHNIGTGQVDREIHMDPMMECDEEPEKL